MENETDEFVPMQIAAEKSGYSYSMIRMLRRRKLIAVHDWFGKPTVKLQDVLDYKHKQEALGKAKFVPMNYRPETIDVTPAE